MTTALASRSVPSQVPSAVHEQLLGIGPVVDPAATAHLYAPLQQQEPYAGVRVTRGQQYGPDPRNLLDLFAPQEPAAASRPVLVFLHGGAFTGGERRRPGSPFYDNVMLWAVKNGMVGVNMTYRLAPQFQWPAAQQDVAAALAWVRQHIAAVGGDAARIVLMGHSAGAAHVAQSLAHPQFHRGTGGVVGAVLASGLYDMGTAAMNPPLQSYFGSDPSVYAQRSAVPGLVASKLPLLLAYAELDPPDFKAQSEQLHAALRAAGRPATLLQLLGHSHMSEIYAVNTADRSLSDPLAAFVKSLR